MSDPVAQAELESRRCQVEGCRAWRKGQEPYCAAHYRLWQLALAAGDPDPVPRLVTRHGPACAARSCRNLAMPNSIYCPTHAALTEANVKDAESIAAAFEMLLAHLDESPHDAFDTLVREQQLLDAARRILLAHARTASRTGWASISAMTFIRLWVSSASTMHDLTKSRFVMESAGGGSTSRLLGRVYSRLIDGIYGPIDAILSAQPVLPEPDDAEEGSDAEPRMLTPEEALAEWMIDATHAVGSSLAADALRFTAAQAGAPEPYGEALAALAQGWAEEGAEPAEPLALSDLLATLGDILCPALLAGGLPDVGEIRRLIEEGRGR